MPKRRNSRECFKKWYKTNGEEWNSKRRERYAKDPLYRARVLAWSKLTKVRKREDEAKERQDARRAVKMRSTGAWKTVEVEVDGVVIRMFTIGALAKAVGKGISTIRVWERTGVLPETPYRSDKGDRLYTIEMVETVRNALRKAGKLKIGVLQERERLPYIVKHVKFNGIDDPVRMRLYRVGMLAKAVKKTVVAVVQLEKRKVLPRTPLVASSLKHRLYTLDMIEVVQTIFQRHGNVIRIPSEQVEVYDEIVDGWTNLGFMDARILE